MGVVRGADRKGHGKEGGEALSDRFWAKAYLVDEQEEGTQPQEHVFHPYLPDGIGADAHGYLGIEWLPSREWAGRMLSE